jgi:amidophosphoribosyltransferase
MEGRVAIGHVRYSTQGDSKASNAQPLEAYSRIGAMVIAHNGNLVNHRIIRELMEAGGTVFQTEIDSEVILHLIARSLEKGFESSISDAVSAIKGSYAVTIAAQDKLIGVRDPYGIRPLCIGKKDEMYFLSSESCAIHALGGKLVRDVEPGEIVIIDEKGIRSIKSQRKTTISTCAFEYNYFARPDSTIDGLNVYHSRIESGKIMAKTETVEADLVVGVPDSGMQAAFGFSKESGLELGLGLIKNRYIGRTFIAPNQELRERSVALKLSAMRELIEGKRIILIDDSIVRGTTSRKLVDILKEGGAKEVHFRVASPPVKSSCFLGIDTPYRDELIAANNSIEDIRNIIGADTLKFMSIEDLYEAFGSIKGYCMGCFNGIYPMETQD